VTEFSDDAPGVEPLLRALGGLAAGQVDLRPRIFAHWCEAGGPIGDVFVAFTDRGACYLRTIESVDGEEARFAESFRQRFNRPLRLALRPPVGLVSALRRGRLGKLPVDLRGLTIFEQSVLRATLGIPHGQIRPYSWIAREIGRPGAMRAVGSALGHNPVPLLIPCHRVVRTDGDVGGYIFGRHAKEELLTSERVDLAEIRWLAEHRVFYLGSDTTHIVCFPTCAHARRITRPHRRGFRSIGQAEQAGYRPCLSCRPGAMAG